jgi:hypothetical protein
MCSLEQYHSPFAFVASVLARLRSQVLHLTISVLSFDISFFEEDNLAIR